MVLTSTQENKLRNFLLFNIEKFNPKAQVFWRCEFSPKKEYPYDFVNQVYTYLFPDFINEKYKVFIEYLKDRFPNLSNMQIMEIASGYLPGVSLTLKKLMDIKRSIICIDPLAMDISVEGIENKAEVLTEDTDVSAADILIAHHPCSALDTIIGHAIDDQKEICVQTCPCGHNFHFRSEFYYYIDSLLDDLKELEDYGFEIDSIVLDKDDMVQSPVISVRKREK